MVKIIDDKFTVIERDIEKIQAKPNMYISYTGQAATLHLSKEMINNAIDENENKNTISDGNITIIYNEDDEMLYVQDTGRGIPFDELENACTILHSGSKMLREAGSTAGENGVGITATNALSEVFEITSTRNKEMRFLQFREGDKIVDRTTSIKSDKHGLLVGFKPSKIYLSPNCKLPIEELEDWLLKQSFFIPENIKIKFSIEKSGKDSTSNKVFKNTTGIGGFLAKLDPVYSLLKTPVVLSNHTTIMENDIPIHNNDGSIKLESIMRNIDLEVAINYSTSEETSIDGARYSFCNTIETIEHGEHLNGVMNGFVTFMRKEVKRASKKKDDIEVTNNDILNGLGIVVNLRTDFSTAVFTSQTKHRVGNDIFYNPIRKLTMDSLENYFKSPDNKRVLNKLISVVNDNIKMRQAANKAKKKVRRERKSFMDTKLIDGYTAPNNLDTDGAYREIFIIEGDSAGGTARAGRYNPDTQGVLGLMGKPSNAYGEKSSTLDKSAKDVKILFDDILGCGYGDHFDISNLIYDKIIIMPDADIDGHHIMGLMTSNILAHAPQLILAGKVYRAITPLYQLSGIESKSDIDYTYSKNEFFEMYASRASKIVKLKIDLNDNFISNTNMKRFLETNRGYYDLVVTLAGYYSLHPDIVEYMASHRDFRDTLRNCGPELDYNKERDSIVGIYDGERYDIIMDSVLLSNIDTLSECIEKGNNGIDKLYCYKKFKSKVEPDYVGYLTIGQIMSICKEYEPFINHRYKGLGELNSSQMRELVMDPHNRKLVKLTLGDIDGTRKIMDDLFLKNHRDVRKELIKNLNITIDDIDN